MFNINECSCDYIIIESSGENFNSYLPCLEDKRGLVWGREADYNPHPRNQSSYSDDVRGW